jgi:riboflavin synthase alpha subunit
MQWRSRRVREIARLADCVKVSGMCLICVEIAKSKMTVKEARQALREMRTGLDREHVAEVEAKLAEAEKAQKP